MTVEHSWFIVCLTPLHCYCKAILHFVYQKRTKKASPAISPERSKAKQAVPQLTLRPQVPSMS